MDIWTYVSNFWIEKFETSVIIIEQRYLNFWIVGILFKLVVKKRQVIIEVFQILSIMKNYDI